LPMSLADRSMVIDQFPPRSRPRQTIAEARCEARVQRIDKFEDAYFSARFGGASRREAYLAASKQNPQGSIDLMEVPGALDALVAVDDFSQGHPVNLDNDPKVNWPDCGPTQYVAFGAGGGGGIPQAPALPPLPDAPPPVQAPTIEMPQMPQTQFCFGAGAFEQCQ